MLIASRMFSCFCKCSWWAPALLGLVTACADGALPPRSRADPREPAAPETAFATPSSEAAAPEPAPRAR